MTQKWIDMVALGKKYVNVGLIEPIAICYEDYYVYKKEKHCKISHKINLNSKRATVMRSDNFDNRFTDSERQCVTLTVQLRLKKCSKIMYNNAFKCKILNKVIQTLWTAQKTKDVCMYPK